MTARTRRIPRVGAFFDMDKTLLAENSGAVYVRHRYENGKIDGFELARSALVYLQYKAGILDIRAWTRAQVAQFAGLSEEEILRDAREVMRRVARTVYPEAMQAVRWHQEQGHLVAIVSGSTRYIVEPIAEQLGVEHTLYTRLEVVDGRLTGRVIEPICFEEGKIYWLRDLVAAEGIDLAKSWFYTDSITDLPLLELVGHPVVTNPDPRIYREARRRRWPIRFFQPPASVVAPDGKERTPARGETLG